MLLVNPQPVQSQIRDDTLIDLARIESYVVGQMDLGPRIPGSEGSQKFGGWLDEVVNDPWQISTQTFEYEGIELNNYLITTTGNIPKYLFLAHWDTRAVADQDPNPLLRDNPVPGANDGASGVAGNLELMNHIPVDVNDQIGFLLVDGEDQGSGGMENWAWIVGSSYFADSLTEEEIAHIEAVVLLDLIGDEELDLPHEIRSDDTLIEQIWGVAHDLGYEDIFLNEPGWALTDDHIPFKNKGIPAIDIIDFNTTEWHTTDDDLDHISYVSIGIVTDVVLTWILDIVNTNFTATPDPSLNITFTTDDTNFSAISAFVAIMVISRFHFRYASRQ